MPKKKRVVVRKKVTDIVAGDAPEPPVVIVTETVKDVVTDVVVDVVKEVVVDVVKEEPAKKKHTYTRKPKVAAPIADPVVKEGITVEAPVLSLPEAPVLSLPEAPVLSLPEAPVLSLLAFHLPLADHFAHLLRSFFIAGHRYVGLNDSGDAITPAFFRVVSASADEILCQFVRHASTVDADGVTHVAPQWDNLWTVAALPEMPMYNCMPFDETRDYHYA